MLWLLERMTLVKLRIPTREKTPHGVKCFETSKRSLNPQFLLLFKLVVTINVGLIYELSNRGHSCERVLQGDRFSFYSGHCGNWYEYIQR